jgi:hypothetical protein
MFTANQCRAKALEKLGLARTNPQHRRRFIQAADAWFLLADRLQVGEAIMENARAVGAPLDRPTRTQHIPAE